MYPADGRKIPDHYAEPVELHAELDRLLSLLADALMEEKKAGERG